MPRTLVTTASTLTTLLSLPGGVGAQTGPPGGPPPTIPGTAVLYRSPVQVDTIPILCYDAERPEVGFETESTDPEWTPTVALTLWPTPGTADSLSIRFDDGTSVVDRTVPRGTPQTGMLSLGVNVVPWDTGRGVDLQIGANCTERLTREG